MSNVLQHQRKNTERHRKVVVTGSPSPAAHGSESTLAPVMASAYTGGPEFADTPGVKQLYSLSKTHLYNLLEDGKIRACVLRRKGAARGRRLWDVASIRAYLHANMEGGTQ